MMSAIRRFLSRLRNLVLPGRAEDELSRELAAHVALIQDELQRRGMAPEDARRQALLALGGVEQTKELHRDERSFAWLDDARRDARYALRMFLRNPVMAATAALSVGIGIGANTAVFTVANAMLFRPPDGVTDAGRLVDIGSGRPDGGFNPTSYPNYLDIRARTTTLDGVYAHPMFSHAINADIEGTGVAIERIYGHLVTTNYFVVLGVQPVAGRLFSSADSEQPGASPVVVLSHAFWKRRFNGDSGIVGRTIRLNDHPFEIVGVAPAGFHGTGVVAEDLWAPVTMGPVLSRQPASVFSELAERSGGWLVIGGRLKANVTVAQAAAEVERIGRDLDREHPPRSESRPLRLVSSSVVPGNRGVIAVFLGLLMAIVSVILIVACANVSAVLLARAAARRREIAVRLALGAGRSRLVRQLLMETSILFGVGGVIGLTLAVVMMPIVIARLPSLPFPVAVALTPDVRVIAFTTALALLAALLSGLAPALQASKVRVEGPLKDDSHGSARGSRLRSAFVLVQVALTVLLLVTAGLFVRALARAGSTDPGFDSRGVQLVSIDLTMGGYTEATAARFWREVRDRVRQMPGVQAATVASILPGGFEGIGLSLSVPGATATPPDSFRPSGNIVEPGYFDALRIPLVAGRDFTDTDVNGAPQVVIVGEDAARHFWPGENAIGKYLAEYDAPGSATKSRRMLMVVGVARDIKTSSLIDGLAGSFIYLPLQQQPYSDRLIGNMTVVARTTHGPRFADEIRAVVGSINPRVQIATSQTLDDSIALGLVPQRIAASVAGSLGSVGLLLAAIGIYGVTAFTVTRRTREFGIRMALGARPVDIVRMVLRHGIILTTIGAAIGLGLGALVGVALGAFLFDAAPFDPVTFGGTAILFITIALAACYGPARRATTVDPLLALRDE